MSLLILILAGGGVFLWWQQHHWQAEEWPSGALQAAPFQAHRGFHAIEQENTLAAFRAAREQGAEMIELDVRLSRDGQVVVFHDVDLRRLGGEATLVSALTAEELRLRVSAPLLEEVLRDPSVPSLVNIEIKSRSALDGRLEKAVAAVIEKTQSSSRVLISSFNPLALFRMSRLLPAVPRALLATQEPAPDNKIYLRRMWLAPYIGVHLLHLDHRDLTPEDIQNYRRRRIPVALWTVNEESRARAFLAAGALSIISDSCFRSE